MFWNLWKDILQLNQMENESHSILHMRLWVFILFVKGLMSHLYQVRQNKLQMLTSMNRSNSLFDAMLNAIETLIFTIYLGVRIMYFFRIRMYIEMYRVMRTGMNIREDFNIRYISYITRTLYITYLTYTHLILLICVCIYTQDVPF